MRVVIADDFPHFREGLRALLTLRGVDVVCVAENVCQAFQLARSLRPDLVLMDVNMPEMDGIEATRRICGEMPGVRVVMLSANDDQASVLDAIRAGAQGYLCKTTDSDRFYSLLEGVIRDEPAFTPSSTTTLIDAFARPARASGVRPDVNLTAREHEILCLLREGVTSNRSLAERLVLSENTVKFHLRNLLDKLNLQSRAQAAGYGAGLAAAERARLG